MTVKRYLALLAIPLLWALLMVARSDYPPGRDGAARLLAMRSRHFRHNLLAYADVDGTPYVLYHVPLDGRSRIFFRRLEMGWSAAWRVADANMGSAVYTDAPANLGVSLCPSGEQGTCREGSMIFGQINDPSITTIEVHSGSERRRHPVSHPGFIVRLEGAQALPGGPSDYRWLDVGGGEVWSKARGAPPTPTPQPRRGA